MNPVRKLFIFFFILAFIFSPISFSNILVYSQEEGEDKEDSDIIELHGFNEWSVDKPITENYLVSSDGILVIEKGVTITFSGGRLDVEGKLFIKGTVNDPAKIRKGDAPFGYSISIQNGGSAFVTNADVSGGGDIAIPCQNDKSIFNKAYAQTSVTGAFQVWDGRLEIQGTNFHDNAAAISSGWVNPISIKVNRSKFTDNRYDASVRNPEESFADFRYNWWGSENGPGKICPAPSTCYYEKISSNINFSPWLTQEDFRDPVIVVPGIMGSWKISDEWKIDPILHTYESLYETLDENGYTPEQDLFTFPYEWRDSNSINAPLLRDKINAIKQARNWPKVDIITHSMGGLLARKYVESNYYRDDIDQLITLGTSHKGAPKDYLAWEGGEMSASKIDIASYIIKYFFKHEANKKGYDSIFDYIRRRPIESVRELLPVYDYLKNADSGEMRGYPDGYPTNPFLENLNLEENRNELLNVSLENIVGNTDSEKTVNVIRVEDYDGDDDLWKHGIPEGYNSLFGDHGLEMGAGDRTVPLSSSLGVRADNVIITNYAHGDLPGKSANDVYELLTGDEPDHEIDYIKISKLLAFFVFSPIDIQVIASNGKWAGKNINNLNENNQIDGAYYTGSNTDAEFLTIPNPMEGEYKILTQATGDGDYKIEISNIFENEDNPEEASESTAEITGTAAIGQTEELKVSLENNEVTTEPKDEIPPVITIASPENDKSYLNNRILPVNYTVEDETTPANEIISQVYYDGNEFTKSEIDLSLEHLGDHRIKVTAQDGAKNPAEEESSFSVTTDIRAMIDNVNHYYELKLIANKKDKEFLEHQLKILGSNLKLLEKIRGNDRIKPRVKENLIDLFEELANKHIDLIIRFIVTNKRDAFLEKAQGLLIESLNFIRPK